MLRFWDALVVRIFGGTIRREILRRREEESRTELLGLDLPKDREVSRDRSLFLVADFERRLDRISGEMPPKESERTEEVLWLIGFIKRLVGRIDNLPLTIRLGREIVRLRRLELMDRDFKL